MDAITVACGFSLSTLGSGAQQSVRVVSTRGAAIFRKKTRPRESAVRVDRRGFEAKLVPCVVVQNNVLWLWSLCVQAVTQTKHYKIIFLSDRSAR